MPRRPLRFAYNCFCLLSLLACLGTSWAWAATRNQSRGVAILDTRGGVYSLRAAGGRVSLLRPPAPGGADGEAAAARMMARLGNEDVRLQARYSLTLVPTEVGFVLDGDVDADLVRLADPGFADATRPLLAALGDPRKYVAAHALLCRRAGAAGWGSVAVQDGRFAASIEGLRIDLGPKGDGIEHAPLVAPAQLPILRRYWYEHLGEPAATVRARWLVLGLALPPASWLLARKRRSLILRRRLRLGLCRRCGYDLTGNPSGRCSECGEAVEANSGRVTA